MSAWDRMIQADHRVAQLGFAAEQAVRDGHQAREYPDAVYMTAKRYLQRLTVGPYSLPVPIRRPDSAWYEAWFAEVVALPAPTLPEADRRFLAGHFAYQVACTHIFDRLCEVYDQRHRWAE